MTKSNYLENEILDHILKVGTWNSPTNIYLALTQSTIEEDDTGSTLPSEVSGGSYARPTLNTWTAAASGSSTNSIAKTFAQATAVWGTVTDFCLVTHSTTGQVLYKGKLTTSKKIATNDQAKFATNDIKISED